MAESKAYTGSCHCKHNQFEVTFSPPLSDETNKVIKCNCSICNTNGYLLAFTAPGAVKWAKGGLDDLKKYNFNTGKFTHYFCPNCGTSMCVIGAMGGNEMIGINTRSFDDVNVEKLHLREFDGKSI